MRILHLIADLSRQSGGPAKSILDIANCLSEKNIEIDIATTNYGVSNNDIEVLKKKFNFNIFFFNTNFPLKWKRSIGLKNFLKKNIKNYDLVHMHSMYLYHNYVGYKFAKKYNIPIIIRPHGTLDPVIQKRLNIYRIFMNILFQKNLNYYASKFHFTSKIEYELCTEILCKRKSKIISLPINLKNYFKKTKKMDTDLINKLKLIKGDRYSFLFFGRLNYKKGIDILLKAFYKFYLENNNIVLFFVGPDEGEKTKIQKFISKYHLDQNIYIFGFHNRPDEFFEIADYFVLPSQSENFGLSIFESLAYGLPVIVSNKVSIHEDININEFGYVCDYNFESVFNCLLKATKKKHSNISNNFKIYYEKNFNISKTSNDFIDMYNNEIK